MHVIRKLPRVVSRRFSTKPKISVQLEETVDENINSGKLNPKKHPGIIHSKSVGIPTQITDTIKLVLGDTPIKSVSRDGELLGNYLRSRHPPTEEKRLLKKRLEIVESLSETEKIDLTGKDLKEVCEIEQKRERKIQKILKERIQHWKAIPYDKYTSLKYLTCRAAPEYAVLHKLFNEINRREVDYKPKSFFDFGSGVGTGTWAVKEFWKDSLEEVFTVDVSPDMNNLARLILCDGVESDDVPIKRFYQRQFLPATPMEYNIVLSAYSLFELPSAQSRLLTVLNLWRKVKDFLIIVEHGTNAGYSLVNEARDFILECKEESLIGHVYSPCPHDQACPRFFEDNTPCNFPINYSKLKVGIRNETGHELYSYVILRKGKRPEGEPTWPRIVRPALARHRHVVCRMCCDDGKLKEVIFTPSKHGKNIYNCSKHVNWGDRFPIKLSTSEEIVTTSENSSIDVDPEKINNIESAPSKVDT